MARWYIIHAYSGFENKVKEAIQAEAERLGLSQLVEQIEVPSEQVTEVKRGKKVEKDARKAVDDIDLPKLELESLTDRKKLEARLDKAKARFEDLKDSVNFKTAA